MRSVILWNKKRAHVPSFNNRGEDRDTHRYASKLVKARKVGDGILVICSGEIPPGPQ